MRRLMIAVALPLGLLASMAVIGAGDGAERLVRSARAYVGLPIVYDGGYRKIVFPGGDPGGGVGGCSDLVIRAYRGLGVDLQVLVHEDVKKDFDAYPFKSLYNQSTPDANIDHRRVPNLDVFLGRNARTLGVSINPEDLHQWRPGDLVLFDLLGNGRASHIGVVSDKRSANGLPLVIHHFPPHPTEEDVLARWKIVGHYRFFPKRTGK